MKASLQLSSKSHRSSRLTIFAFQFALLLTLLIPTGSVWGQTTVNCYPPSQTYATGYTSSSSKTSGEMRCIGNSGVQGWMKFDVSSIPNNAVISSIVLHFYNTSTNNCYVKLTAAGQYDPVNTAASTLYSAITDASTNYYTSTYISGLSSAGWKTFTLSSSAVNNLQNAGLTNDYFTIGFYEYESSSSYYLYAYGYNNSTYKPYITVTYTLPTPATIPFSDNFESNSGWQNGGGYGGQQWTRGTAASNGGSYGFYVTNGSTNDTYGANNYSNYSSSGNWCYYAYRTLSMSAGTYVVSYDWRANGESTCDFLRVALVPASTTLTDGTNSSVSSSSLPSGWIAADGGSKLNLSTTWASKSSSVTVPSTGEYNLVFIWSNDYSVQNQPPAAIDNISVSAPITVSTSVSPAGAGTVTGGGDYASGATATLTAVPTGCYKFVNWTENGSVVSTNSTYSFTVNSNRTLVANFEEWNVDITASPATAECISPATELVLTGTTDLPMNYNFTSTTSSFSSISGSPDGTSSNTGDAATYAFNLPFAFNLAGKNFAQGTTLTMRCDGFVSFGSVYNIHAPSSPGTSYSVISPFGYDQTLVSGSSYMYYKVTGSVGSRVLTMEWKNMKSYSYANYENYQVKLYEGSNIVELCYGSYTHGSTISIYAYLSADGKITKLTSFATPVVETNTSGTTTAISVSSAATAPASGTVYRFTPPVISYAWSYSGTSGSASGNTYTVSPTALSNTYTVSATASGCTKTANYTVTTAPTISSVTSNATSNTICNGGSTQLSVSSNASSFTWNNGTGSGSTVTVSPSTTTTYTVTATSGSCTNTGNITITVTDPLSISNISVPSEVSSGCSLTLTTPTVTGSGITSQGWQISADNSSWSSFTNGSSMAASQNGYFLRYYATNACGSVYSNVVQITVSDVEVGDLSVTTTDQYLPSYPFFNYSLTQQIYTPCEVGYSGSISSISFYNGGNTRTPIYDIYLVHTDKYNFSGTTDWITVTASDRVFSGAVTMTSGQWTTINFATPFQYNGTSNLAVIIDDNIGTHTGSMGCRVYNADGNQALRVYSDGTNYDPYSPTSYTGTLMTVKNQLKFGMCSKTPAVLYTVTATASPAEGGSVTGLAKDGCYASGTTATLTAVPTGCYKFVNWTENGSAVSNNPTYSFTVAGNRTLVANFEEWNVDITASPATAECISPATELVLTGTTDLPMNYNFTSTTSSFSSISGSPDGTSSNTGDAATYAFNLPFAFNLAGKNFAQGTTLTMRCDGFVSFGSVYNIHAPSSPGTSYSVISPFGYDQTLVSGSSYMYYKVTGSVGSRVLTMEWKNMKSYSYANYENYQVKLYEGSNIVELCYGSYTHGSTISIYAYLSADGKITKLTSFATPVVETNTSGTTTAISVSSAATAPANGTVYRFTPPVISYAWSYSGTSGSASGNSYTVSPTALSNTYTVSATTNGCTKTDNYTVTTAPTISSVTSNATNNTICNGGSTQLSVSSNASSFTWDNGAGSGSTVTVSPSTTTTYNVVATAGSCTNTGNITITVNDLPTVADISAPAAVCAGNPLSLTAPTVTWNSNTGTQGWQISSDNNNWSSFDPAAAVVFGQSGYYLRYFATNSCGTTYSNTVQMTVNDQPVITEITSSAGIAICGEGNSTTLTAVSPNATGFSWNTGASTQSITVTPTNTATYTVTASIGSCTTNGSIDIELIKAPVLTVSPVATECITPGTELVLSASTDIPVEYNFSVTSGTFSSISGTSSVSGDDSYSSAISIPFNFNYWGVNYNSVVIATNGYLKFVGSSSNTLSNDLASTTYYNILAAFWDDLDANSTVYTTTGTAPNRVFTMQHNGFRHGDSGNTFAFQIKLYEGTNIIEFVYGSGFPNLTSSSTSASIGLNNYANGATSFISVTPTGNGTATTSTTTSNNNIGTTQCDYLTSGTIYRFTPSTANSYAWTYTGTGGTAYGGSYSVAPAALENTYTVSNTIGGCTLSASQTVTTIPTISSVTSNASGNTICNGGSTQLSVSSNASSFAWDNGAGNGSTVTVSPATTTTYTVTATAGACTNTGNITITVNDVPTVANISAPAAVCAGNPLSLTAPTVTWNGNTGTQGWQISANNSSWSSFDPATAVVFSQNGYYLRYFATNTCGTTYSNTVQMTVNDQPVITEITSTAGTAICGEGNSTTLTAVSPNATDFSWDNGAGNEQTVTVTPLATTTYTVVASIGSCSASGSINIIVANNPTITVTPNPDDVCLDGTTQVVLKAADVVDCSLADYTFTTGTNSSKWYNVTNTTNLITSSGDGVASAVQEIGFTFPFAGNSYTQFSVNSDGNLRLGSTVTGTSNYSSPFSSSNANANNPKINGMGFDGYYDISNYSNHVYKQVFGTAPNRVLVVEYRESPYSSSYRQYTWNWQVQLSENGNVQIVYGPTAPGSYNYTNQIGLCVDASDGYTISTTNHTATHFTAGTSTTNTAANSWPGAYRYYSFTPPTPSFAWTYEGTAGVANNNTYTVTPTENNNTYTVTNTVTGCSQSKTITLFNADNIVVDGIVADCGTSTTLTASGLDGATYNWYSDAACTDLIQSNSATFTTPALSQATTYYVKAEKTAGNGELVEYDVIPFSYTGAVQSYTLPAGTAAVKMEVWGAQGGSAGTTYRGGKGGYSVGTMAAQAGDVLKIYVGGEGGGSKTSNSVYTNGSVSGGFNGGGQSYQTTESYRRGS